MTNLYQIKMAAALFGILLCVSCTEQKQSVQPGYIEGEYTYMASNIPGTLQQLAVSPGQEVQQGELLFQFESEPESSSVKANAANIKNLEAQVNFYRTQLERQQYLLKENATSKMNMEKAQIEYDSYVQQLAASRAQFVETQWSLDQKTVTAPINGQVYDTFYQVGEKIMAYKPVLSLVDPQNLKVIFYVPEKELDKIKIGQVVSFDCDRCQGKTQATLSYISPMAEYTPPLIYSKDSRDQLVYLVRASMPIEAAKKFRPGQPVDVYLHE